MKKWIYPNQNYSYDPYAQPKETGAWEAVPYDTDDYMPSPSGMLLPVAPLYCYPSTAAYERDRNYLLSLYPDRLKPILDQILMAVDSIDKPGSFLYDSYPDKESLLRLVFQIYDTLAALYPEDSDARKPDSDTSFLPPGSDLSDTMAFTVNPRNSWLLSLIQVLLSNEMLLRRQQNAAAGTHSYR